MISNNIFALLFVMFCDMEVPINNYPVLWPKNNKIYSNKHFEKKVSKSARYRSEAISQLGFYSRTLVTRGCTKCSEGKVSYNSSHIILSDQSYPGKHKFPAY